MRTMANEARAAQGMHREREAADASAQGFLHRPWEGRAIMLLDLDAFFASVEQLDHPEWRGKPVIVGGDARRHGVVSTCSYEARAFGVHSAMPASAAAKLCPDAIWAPGRHGRYRELSDQIMTMIRDETPYVEQVSVDEAFADISPSRVNTEHPVAVAERIQKRVREEVGLTCSIGLGTTKSVAKIASDMDKPHGLTVVYPGSEQSFLFPLPIKKLSGVGASAQAKLGAAGIRTLKDLAEAEEEVLASVFGIRAAMMRARARGEEASEIVMERDVKSISHETTFAEVLTEREDIHGSLTTLLGKVARRLRKKQLKARTLAIKIRFEDRSLRNAQCALDQPNDDEIALAVHIDELLDKVWRPNEPVRLLGVRASGFAPPSAEVEQTALFQLEAEGEDAGAQPIIPSEEKRRGLINATDALKDRFGEDAVFFGAALRNSGNDTGPVSDHLPE